MKLHTNKRLFEDAILSASRPVAEGGLGISSLFIEKDYWICRSLALMSAGDTDGRAVFKGGTSLTKAYGIGARFSEDIDIAIADAWKLSGNQLRNVIRSISKRMTEGLEEIVIPGKTSKGSHYHKAFYQYPCVSTAGGNSAVVAGQLLVEINSFANPYPTERHVLRCFLTDFLEKTDNMKLVEDYGMQPFEVTVLDKRRTLTEKLVSLFRQSFEANAMIGLAKKIRHFYDLYHLCQDAGTQDYLLSDQFVQDFISLYRHDQEAFDKPLGWRERTFSESLLMSDFHHVWQSVQSVYLRELPQLAYRPVPSAEKIERSVAAILDRLR